TAGGGTVGPRPFGTLIETGGRMPVAVGFRIAPAARARGGLAERRVGGRAGGRKRGARAAPPTAEGAEAAAGDGTGGSSGPPGSSGAGGKRADGGPDPSQGRA